MNFRPVAVAAAATATAALLLSACSAPSPEPGAGSEAGEGSVVIDNCGVELTFDEVPSRVLILNGVSVAEVSAFVELGIQDSVIANLQSYGVSDDPALADQIAELPTGDLSMNENFGPPAEQVLALQPDLVVSTTASGFDAGYGFATRDELAAAGAQTFITPARCADGNADATAEELERYDTAGIDGSYELLRTLGQIFRVEDRAEEVIAGMEADLASVEAAVEGKPAVRGVVMSPGHMSDAPMAWTGGIVDDVLARAGVENVFAGQGTLGALNISAEQLAAVDPEIIITFGDASLDSNALIAELSQQFPNWTAVKTPTVVNIHDGLYLGTTHDEAVDKIARAAHPDAF